MRNRLRREEKERKTISDSSNDVNIDEREGNRQRVIIIFALNLRREE